MFNLVGNTFANIRDVIANDNELDNESLRFLSLLLLLLCGIMSLLQYTHEGIIWDTSFSFKPTFLSSIMGVALLFPLYARRILKWNKSTYGIISFVLILMVFSSFVQLAIGGDKNSWFIQFMLVASVALSWLGIRGIASISWLLVLVAAIISAIHNNMAMGFYGFVYIASGTVGLILHSGLNPGDLIFSIKKEYFIDYYVNDVSDIYQAETQNKIIPVERR